MESQIMFIECFQKELDDEIKYKTSNIPSTTLVSVSFLNNNFQSDI